MRRVTKRRIANANPARDGDIDRGARITGAAMATMITVVIFPWAGMVGLSGVALGFLLRAAQARRRRRNEVGHRRDSVTATIEFTTMVMAVHASPVSLSEILAASGPVAMRDGWAHVLHRYQLGAAFSVALDELVHYGGEDYRPLVGLLRHADREGIAVAILLARLGDEARRRRHQERERHTRALSVQLLLPLVVCSLPAVVLGSVIPLAWVAFRAV